MSPITEDLQSTFQYYEKTFKALADQKRLHLLNLLAASNNDSICVCDLAEDMGMAQSKLSYHLKILLQANLIIQEKKGTWSYYSLNHDEINNVLSEELCCLFRKSNDEKTINSCSCDN
ncbi:ArsR/SmtB family transcription factor [Aquisalibacillus elongatus]|uniref:ArsR family transcriptional regulator n=1 Tax=Aquisalibacillus elongatus TaxID=485577 RepID=A0A3N5BUL2_9BACI|nr:metalloregulator ArsR/SmtB family transcription factor [Aquisalibacillus elongatus]RPF53458.1 ArsR family transcriptional regulator [Aquisalibacillus elongatus]